MRIATAAGELDALAIMVVDNYSDYIEAFTMEEVYFVFHNGKGVLCCWT